MKHLFYLFVIIVLYFFLLFRLHPSIFQYKFDKKLVGKYFHSQDIPHEVTGRVFLSDGDIHIAAGYLYATGENPISYNFQHPPFIKYLYGFSTLLWGNPYYVQILLGLLYLGMVYLLAFRLFKSSFTSFLSTLLLVADPFFIDLSAQTLLDLGQAALLLVYIYAVLYKKNNFVLQGTVLGLLAASKFWAAPLFFVILLSLYTYYKKELRLRSYILHFGVAVLSFMVVYSKAFWDAHGAFNIVFFELKTVKYWLVHSVSSIVGASLILFVTGYVKSWWGDFSWIRTQLWNALWPVSLVISTTYGFLHLKKKLPASTFLAFLPIVYLFYLGVQAPFNRYFILILPFCYIITAHVLTTFAVHLKPRNSH